MNYKINVKKNPFTKVAILTALVCSVSTSSAVLNFNGQLGTSSGAFSLGTSSWTGDGNIAGTAPLINDFTSGTLNFKATATNNSNLISDVDIAWTISILGGGTADLDFDSNNNRFFLRNFQNGTGDVRGINMSITYGGLIAAANPGSTGNGQPWGFAFGGNLPSGDDPSEYRHNVELLGVVSDNDNDGTFEKGLGTDGNDTLRTKSFVQDGGVTSTSFSHDGISPNGDGGDFIRGVNYDGFNNNEDGSLAYLGGMNWDVERVDSDGNSLAIDNGTTFRVTFDGRHYANQIKALDPVPEPSSSLLMGLGAILLGMHRRRKS